MDWQTKRTRTTTIDLMGFVWWVVFLMIVIPGALTLTLESLLALVVISNVHFNITWSS